MTRRAWPRFPRPNQIHKWKKQAQENFNQLIAEERQGAQVQEAAHERELNELYAEIGRLSAQLSWLKKNLASNWSRGERLAMLEKDHPELSLKVPAELLGLSYASLFYQPVPPSPRELAIKRRIDEVYTAHPYYGSRKITVILRSEFGVSRPTAQAYMREMGLAAVVPGPIPANWHRNT